MFRIHFKDCEFYSGLKSELLLARAGLVSNRVHTFPNSKFQWYFSDFWKCQKWCIWPFIWTGGTPRYDWYQSRHLVSNRVYTFPNSKTEPAKDFGLVSKWWLTHSFSEISCDFSLIDCCFDVWLWYECLQFGIKMGQRNRKRGKKERKICIIKGECFKIMHPQRRVPSEARDVAAAEKNLETSLK